jgi:uncharacterized protein YsxB (DUF464 family)
MYNKLAAGDLAIERILIAVMHACQSKNKKDKGNNAKRQSKHAMYGHKRPDVLCLCVSTIIFYVLTSLE